MFHPIGLRAGHLRRALDSHKGPQACCILSKEFYETDLSRGFVRGYNLQITRGSGPVATAMAGYAAARFPGGRATTRRSRNDSATIGVHRHLCEDLPEHHNTVTLDPELMDSDGIPAPKITYRYSENSLAMMAHGLARGATEVMQAAGAREITCAGPLRRHGLAPAGHRAHGRRPRDARWSTAGAAAMT